ncbi:MAG: DUF3943 domain-containing protein [Pseudobdellovibrionaceae bacterium]|nr:DUF3943 domain-containing protein [Pseudobdellovibrionaceae bacterium]
MISRPFIILLLSLLLGLPSPGNASDDKSPVCAYSERQFTDYEHLSHLGLVYGVSWIVYPLTQPRILRGELGSWRLYRENLGKVVFDHDRPRWNWLVHPVSGSQLYLFYRAIGNDRHGSFLMTFISSALFEFTIETYSEPASIQDLYQTPVLGTALGYGIEIVSADLLSRESKLARYMGRIINPFSFLVDRASFTLVPITDFHSTVGLRFHMGI